MSYQACPICGGQGHVAKPPWVAGDVHRWSDTGTGSYRCGVCCGLGVIASPAKAKP